MIECISHDLISAVKMQRKKPVPVRLLLCCGIATNSAKAGVSPIVMAERLSLVRAYSVTKVEQSVIRISTNIFAVFKL